MKFRDLAVPRGIDHPDLHEPTEKVMELTLLANRVVKEPEVDTSLSFMEFIAQHHAPVYEKLRDRIAAVQAKAELAAMAKPIVGERIAELRAASVRIKSEIRDTLLGGDTQVTITHAEADDLDREAQELSSWLNQRALWTDEEKLLVHDDMRDYLALWHIKYETDTGYRRKSGRA